MKVAASVRQEIRKRWSYTRQPEVNRQVAGKLRIPQVACSEKSHIGSPILALCFS